MGLYLQPVRVCSARALRHPLRVTKSAAMHSAVMHTIGVLLVVSILAFQAFVTFRVRRSALFDSVQKRLQTRLIWLVPMFGAALVFSVLSTEERHEQKQSQDS